jgi:hypothetical protein
MSHVTNQSQRDINKEINECMERNSSGDWVKSYIDHDGEQQYEWKEAYTCGPSVYAKAAQDKCPKCGKIFTY